jgi:hypothetical protein
MMSNDSSYDKREGILALSKVRSQFESYGWSQSRALERMKEFERDAQLCVNRKGAPLLTRAARHMVNAAEIKIFLQDYEGALSSLQTALTYDERGVSYPYPSNESYLNQSEIDRDKINLLIEAVLDKLSWSEHYET